MFYILKLIRALIGNKYELHKIYDMCHCFTTFVQLPRDRMPKLMIAIRWNTNIFSPSSKGDQIDHYVTESLLNLTAPCNGVPLNSAGELHFICITDLDVSFTYLLHGASISYLRNSMAIRSLCMGWYLIEYVWHEKPIYQMHTHIHIIDHVMFVSVSILTETDSDE